jgi:hypothetical protein
LPKLEGQEFIGVFGDMRRILFETRAIGTECMAACGK